MLVVSGLCPRCARVGGNMGAVFTQPGRAAEHGCSDCVIICQLKNILFEQRESS